MTSAFGNARGTQLGCIDKDNLLSASWGKGEATARHNQAGRNREKQAARWFSDVVLQNRRHRVFLFWFFFLTLVAAVHIHFPSC